MLGAELDGIVNRAEMEKGTAGEGMLPRDGKSGGLDGGEDFGEGFTIELLPVET